MKTSIEKNTTTASNFLAQCTFKHNISDRFIRKIDLQATDQLFAPLS